MLLSPTVKVGGDHYSRTVAPLFPHCYNYHPFYIFALSPTLTPVGDPLHYKRRPMRRGKGGHPVDIYPRPSSKLTVASCAPEQELESIQTSSSRVLRIRAARSWVKSLRVCVCVSPRSALCATSAPRRTEKGLRPHRCSRRTVSPDISGAPGRGRRGCANLIRRSRGRILHQPLRIRQLLQQQHHGPEKEGFGGRRPVCVSSAASRANGGRGRRRRKGGRRRGRSRRHQTKGQAGRPSLGLGGRAASVPASDNPAAPCHRRWHPLAGPRANRRFAGCPGPPSGHEQSKAAEGGPCSF